MRLDVALAALRHYVEWTRAQKRVHTIDALVAAADDVALNVGRYMRHVIERGVIPSRGKNVEIGGPADVAVVGPNGARWWQRTRRAQRRRG